MQVVSGAKEVTLPSGVTYTDVKIGGGSPVQKGYLMILDFKYAILHTYASLLCQTVLRTLCSKPSTNQHCIVDEAFSCGLSYRAFL